MDKFEQIAWDAKVAVAILGNGTEFELIDLERSLPSEERRRQLTARGMGFIGVIGLVNGAPKTALAVEVDPLTISALAAAFIRRVEERIIAVEEAALGDSLPWRQRLFNLPDARGEAN